MPCVPFYLGFIECKVGDQLGLVGILTGYNRLKNHLTLRSVKEDDETYPGSLGENETPLHFLGTCVVLPRIMHLVFGVALPWNEIKSLACKDIFTFTTRLGRFGATRVLGVIGRSCGGRQK